MGSRQTALRIRQGVQTLSRSDEYSGAGEAGIDWRPLAGDAARIFAVAVLYCVLAKLGLALASINPSATPIWPPTGFAIAAIFVCGYRVWPGIFIGAFVANALTAGTYLTSSTIAVGNTLEAVAAVFLARSWSSSGDVFVAPAGVAKFATVCLPATMISATVGVGSLAAAGFADPAHFLAIWMTWWLGNVAGAVVVAPVIVHWCASDRRTAPGPLSRDSVVAYVGAVAVGLIAFSPLLGTTVDRGPAGFLAILPLLWAALRCTQRETATVALVLSAFAVWGTMAGGGLFERLGLNESFLLLTMFMISTAAPSHALSADVAVRRAAEATLRRQELDLLRARGELERRVEQRTAALAGTNRALQTEIERRKRVEVDLHRDVAERKRTQQALTESERRFRLLMDGVTDYAIFMLDLEGRVANWNTGAERIKGYAADEIIGRHFSCFYTEADRSEARPARALEAAARNGKCESEGWRVRKDGSRFWANVVVHAIRDESGCLIGFAKVTRDMTERREAQAALDRTREEFWQAQKMEALGHLTGGMAHDFNNFLTAVIGNIELVRATGLGEADDRRLESALQAARHGATLIRQMLVFARKQPLEVRCVDVNVVVEEIVPLIRRSCPENVQITTRTPKSPLPVTADSNLLQTSILNLALNARDAMPDGGTLTISIAGYNARGQGDPMPSRPDVRHIPDRVAIEVSDTGVGMSREILERVFEPFFTTKEIGKGTGLGLSMVYGATREMGGDIVIESEPGRGTTARIILPASVGEVPEVDERETDHAGIDASAAAPISLLCVEDDPLVGAATAEILENAGFRIVTVSDGEKALSVLRDRPDIPLVVTDIGLPGIGGHDLISRIRKDRPDLLALFISGHDWCCDAVPESRTDYVPKPYDSRELLRRVQALLSRNRVDCAVCDTAV